MTLTKPIQRTMFGGRRTRWTIDPARTEVGFSVGLMNFATVRGRFARAEGTALLQDAAPHWSRVDLSVDAASVDTRNPVRDFHLRTAEYLDAGRFPEITFRSTHVVPLDAATYRVTGDLTIRGITRTVSLDVVTDETMPEPGRRGFSARTLIHRKDFGVDPGTAGLGFLIGDEVYVCVRGEAVEQDTTEDSSSGEETRRCTSQWTPGS